MNNKVKISTGKQGTTLQASIKINAPWEVVWEVLKFPGKVQEFHPLVKKSFMTSPELNGLGAKRHCDLLPIGTMDEVITEWKAERAVTLEVTGGKMLPPHHFMRGRFELEEWGESTKVHFSFSYQLKFGFLGRLLDTLLVRPQFKKAPPAYVQGLKSYVEKSQLTPSSFSG